MPKKEYRKERMIKPQKMHQEVINGLMEDIQAGVYKVGENLPSERDLMIEFGVSRVTIREAISSLDQSGLLDIRPGRRTKIKEPSADVLLQTLSTTASFFLAQPNGISALHEVRKLIEMGTVRLACSKAREIDIENLAEILAKNKLDIDNTNEFTNSDIKFHYAIAEIVGNPIIMSFYKAIRDWLKNVRDVTLRSENQTMIAYKAHEEIFLAIKNGEVDKSAKLMENHLAQVYEIYFKDN